MKRSELSVGQVVETDDGVDDVIPKWPEFNDRLKP